jgi:uncharacterized membrane protein YfcA
MEVGNMGVNRRKIIQRFWIAFIVLSAIALLILTFSKSFSLAQTYQESRSIMIWLIALAFVAEYVDSSLGMGYGTVLTPILLIMGFSPLVVVPSVLVSEFVTGIFAGTMHHRIGNVNLGRGTNARSIVKIIVAFSIFGTVIAVLLALNLPKTYVKGYIGFMLLSIGVFVLLGKKILGEFSKKKIMGLGAVAAFNKGISGGGYGPLVTGGQVILGVPEKNAVGITSFAEGVVCLSGMAMYFALQGLPRWDLVLPLTVGATLSVPLSIWTVKILPESLLRRSIGAATLFLGSLTILKIIL